MICAGFGTNFIRLPVIVKFRIRNMPSPRNICGPQIRSLRNKAGLTQQELAAKLNLTGWNISRDTLAKIESQVRWLADFEIVLIAKTLGVSISDLYPESRTTERLSRQMTQR